MRLGTGGEYLKRYRATNDIFLDEKILTQPLHWKRPRRIFPCSMSDLFGEWVPDEMIDRVFAVMALCPRHSFQVLTKRAERMRDYMRSREGSDAIDILRGGDGSWKWPLDNAWYGVSVEDQRRADERIPVLLDTPAAVRWVSAEPLLGPVDFDIEHEDEIWHTLSGYVSSDAFGRMGKLHVPINWVVVGGESGPGARPFKIEWARSIIAQCKAAGVAVFMKQLGANPQHNGRWTGEAYETRLRDRKGGDPSEWASDLRVREYPAQNHDR